MIISHKHKFIFLKTEKTAGTSIEIALSKFCGPDDIISPISHGDEKTRTKLGFPGPQNYRLSVWRELVRKALRRKRSDMKSRYFYNHISAKEVIPLIGMDVWNSYYKFCFERNPWDRVISLYFWVNKEEPRPAISEFIRSDARLIDMKKKALGYMQLTEKLW